MINNKNIQRFILAGTFAAALVSNGMPASAQTTAAPVAPPATTSATTVAMSTVDAKAKRQAELEQENADARRVEFLHQGTSL